MAVVTEERVQHIVRLMLKGHWKGMASREKLAEEWGCHERTVGDMAERASSVVACRGKPIEQEIDAALSDLEQIKRMALDNERVIVDKKGDAHYFAAPMLHDAIEAIKLKMDIRGVTSTRRPKDAKPAEHDDEYAKLSKEERIVRLKAALAEEMAVEDGSNGMH